MLPLESKIPLINWNFTITIRLAGFKTYKGLIVLIFSNEEAVLLAKSEAVLVGLFLGANRERQHYHMNTAICYIVSGSCMRQ